MIVRNHLAKINIYHANVKSWANNKSHNLSHYRFTIHWYYSFKGIQNTSYGFTILVSSLISSIYGCDFINFNFSNLQILQIGYV